MDVADCAKRYVCEISATPLHLLSDQDVSTLELLKVVKIRNSSDAEKLEYDLASTLGKISRDSQICRNTFLKCQTEVITHKTGVKK